MRCGLLAQRVFKQNHYVNDINLKHTGGINKTSGEAYGGLYLHFWLKATLYVKDKCASIMLDLTSAGHEQTQLHHSANPCIRELQLSSVVFDA